MQSGGLCPDVMSCPVFPQASRAALSSFPSVSDFVSCTFVCQALWSMEMSLPYAPIACMEMCYTKVRKFADLLSCHPTCLSGARPASPKLWDKKCSLGGTQHCHISYWTQQNQLMPFGRTCALVPVVFAPTACGIFSEASHENNYYVHGKIVAQSLRL